MFDRYPSLPLADAIELFALDNAARRLTRKTRDRYLWEMRQFSAWCAGEGIATLDQVQPAHLRAYANHLNQRTTGKGTTLASSTVHGWLRTLRRFLNFCVEEELLPKTPLNNIRMPRLEQKVLAALTPAEVQRVLRACTSPRDKALFAFLVDTGVRAEELCKLNIGSIDFESGAVLVEGKGQKQRTVYAGVTARKLLRRYLFERKKQPPTSPLFAALKAAPGTYTRALGRRLTPNGIVLLMKRLRQRADVPHLTAHGLRRTFAITCLRNGMDIFTLKELMGHADLTVLHRYLALAQTDLKEAHARYSPLDYL